jgi:hypothetical protein
MSTHRTHGPNGIGAKHRHTTGAVLLAAVTALCGFSIQAQAAITTFIGDKAGFLAATGATSATGTLPNLGGDWSQTVGSVTFTSAGVGTGVIFIGAGPVQIPGGDWYPDPDNLNDLAINGVENMNVTFAGPVYSMGFDIIEPDATMPFWGGIPTDSTFDVTLKNGATTVDTFQFNAEPDDVFTFIGVWSDTAFNRVEIREIGSNNDDEYFGQFYTGTTPLSLLQPVAVDIKPQGCPNPLNTKSQGVTPVAILGTADVDVTQIDIASVRLEDVAAIRSAIEDVATPYTPTNGLDGAPACTDLGPDGFDDLTLKFDAQELIGALGEVEDGEVRTVTLTGLLQDGTPIEGEDVVVIKAKGGGNN